MQMPITCENVARYILPTFRSFIAKELVSKYKLTQNEAAKKLGTTQAAISQYKNSKRGVKGLPDYEEIEPLIQNAASKIAKKMVKTEVTPSELNEAICELCKTIRKSKKCP
jgi:predicted transcriptional regulator